MKEILLNLINLPLRLVLGVGIIIVIAFGKEIPQQLWDVINIPKLTKIIPFKREE